jgi:hypothetical protein
MNLKQFWRYLYNNEVTSDWVMENEKNIKAFINYAWVVFLDSPLIAEIINKTINNYKYNTSTILDKVLYMQHIMKQTKIAYNDLRFYFPSFEKRSEYMKQLKLDVGDIKGLYGLHKAGIINLEDHIVKHEQKKPTKLSKQEKEEIKTFIEKNNVVPETDTLELKILNQEVIDEHELTLFDIVILKKIDVIMYIFIDKQNKKRVYKEAFTYSFNFSTYNNVIDNDYFLPTDQLHNYTIHSMTDLIKLRQAINRNFEVHA